MTNITIIGDTHLRHFKNLPQPMLDAIYRNEYLFHLGDYVVPEIIDNLVDIKGNNFFGVYGNADTLRIRKKVPAKRVIEIDGKAIGLTHPASGGDSAYTEQKAINEFSKDDIDILIYAHTHHPLIEERDDLWLLNPGKGYLEKHYYGPHTSFIILELNKNIKAHLVSLGPE